MSPNILKSLAAAAALLFCAGFAVNLAWLPMLLLKLVPVAAALWWVSAHGERAAYSRWIQCGLVLSLGGDALLALPMDAFVPGLVTFLLAHLAYIAAYVGRSRTLAPGWLILALCAAGSMFGLLIGHGQLGALRGPVAVYSVVIAVMLWRAGAQRQASAMAHWALLGALLFVASDAVLAWNRFVDHDPVLRYVNILLYWLGQWGIAASTMPSRRAPAKSRL